jgi:nucleoside transporter
MPVSADRNISEPSPPLAMGVRFHLSTMMLLEFAIWGAWFVLISNYFGRTLEFTGEQIGLIYSTFALGAVFAPLLVGQIADRWFASQKVLGVLHLVGAAVLVWIAQLTDPTVIFWALLIYALLYNPTIALTNSISFAHISDAARDFGGIRVFGTIGWIVVNLAYLVIFSHDEPVSNFPLYLAAGLSVVLGLYSFFLPHTPAKGKAGELFPFLKAVGLLREPSFAVFFGVSFFIAIILAGYFAFIGLYLADVGVETQEIAPYTTIGQFVEMLLLPFLGFFLVRLGMKWVLVLGMAAWAARYGLFSLGDPFLLVVLGIALHGACFDFFFAAGFIHVENESPKDIRASAQSLYTFLIYGVGMWLGYMVSGWLNQYFTVEKEIDGKLESVTDWSSFWLVPGIGAVVGLVFFAIFFRHRVGNSQPSVPGPVTRPDTA